MSSTDSCHDSDHPTSLPFCDSRHQPISSVMGRNSSSRDKRDPVTLSSSSALRRGTASERLPSLVEAVPEIRRTNPAYDNLSHYPRQLHHDPQGPNRYPVNPSLAPSPPNSRSSYPSNSDVPSSSSLRMSISQRQFVGHDGSEMQLPIHSGPPRRNNGSSLSSGYPGSRHHLNPANPMSAPERQPSSNRRSPNPHNLPSTYNVTPRAPSYPPPHSQPALVAPGISQSNVNYPPSHLHMQRQAEFEAVDVGDKANKKRRGNLPKSTTEILKEWLVQHLDHAYPNEEQKQMLIERTGMSTSQVENPYLT
ncbi:MAG: hypothetical protein Q9167_002621 [Letrouitia subvulpina]